MDQTEACVPRTGAYYCMQPTGPRAPVGSYRTLVGLSSGLLGW